MGSAVIGGIDLCFDDSGGADGAPLVLVHGHPFDRSMWYPQLAHLSRTGTRVIAPDLRGYGTSAVVPGTTGIAVFACDLAALLDHLGIGDVVLGGLSMGGQIAMEFHRLFPDRVRGLLLAATSPRAETAAGARNRTEVAERLLRDGMQEIADGLLPSMIAPDSADTRPGLAWFVRDMMRSTPPAGAAAALRGRAVRPDYTATLATVAVPTLVVVGSEDVFIPLAEAAFLQACVPGAELVVIEGAGHLPNLERPAAFNAAVDRLLCRVAAAAPVPGGARAPGMSGSPHGPAMRSQR
ncbi:alpha/beta fold hydrolase [Pseudonocardia bannensis]|uniref:Alpha/beta fold hydrolase n=1 Tax=Pseudonocardia bannensis TaxID=630973 RepID=A0A848DHC0_9PSEU|nr:alpha/beta fold hydrolase [Pseudonocardia bannensis]NMH91949.1 alpha/beta fold hydrolase [Pseudonocardia bannensis]